jgi:hypothetical protein
MKKRVVTLSLVFAVSGLSGCKNVDVDSTGALPSDIVTSLVSYRGLYQGELYLKSSQSMNEVLQKDFSIDFDIQGDRPVITPRTDILGSECGSKIGRLLNVTVGGIWKAIATFEFNPGHCASKAQGRTATVYVNDNKVVLSIKKDIFSHMGPHGNNSDAREYSASLRKK